MDLRSILIAREAIASRYHDILRKPIETNYLLPKLGGAERAGLVKRKSLYSSAGTSIP